MKKLILIVSIFILVGCSDRDRTPSVLGSDDHVELTDLEFTIGDKEVTSTKLIVHGSVKNAGTIKVSSPWYIEGMFYSDSNYTTIFGGKNTLINFPLESGVSYNWTLYYSSSKIVESDYPYFGFRNVRAYLLE